MNARRRLSTLALSLALVLPLPATAQQPGVQISAGAGWAAPTGATGDFLAAGPSLRVEARYPLGRRITGVVEGGADFFSGEVVEGHGATAWRALVGADLAVTSPREPAVVSLRVLGGGSFYSAVDSRPCPHPAGTGVTCPPPDVAFLEPSLTLAGGLHLGYAASERVGLNLAWDYVTAFQNEPGGDGFVPVAPDSDPRDFGLPGLDRSEAVRLTAGVDVRIP